MITTLTMNPSLDRTSQVEQLHPGAVHRAAPALVEAAGKGVNVSRGLLSVDLGTCAVVACGADAGREFLDILAARGVPVQLIDTGQPVRCNVSVIEADGRTTKLNEPGFEMSNEALEQTIDAVVDLGLRSEWVVGSGSLPPGVSDEFYADLARALQSSPARYAVDTSGPALAAMVGVPCALLKPNRSELASVSPGDIVTVGDAVAAAHRLIEQGADAVLTSLGADGAVLVTEADAVHAVAVVPEMGNTVGAGDSMLAGFLAVGGQGPLALAEGTAWARAALQTKSTEMARPTDADRAAVVSTPLMVDGTVVNADLMGTTLKDDS